ncbi:MAG TPA: DUF5652 family protein [Candidatus Woesebacteria bacterium]|nr:DUF5652 family protein [Bacteroidia bacterium]HNS65619.1 DUF5652 family protein [Candidatus Woesebacteria bacterium]
MSDFVSILSRPEVYVLFLIWSLIWKGIALWQSARKKHLVWFIILLVVNTMGILEILYIFYLNRWDLDQGKLLKFLEKKTAKKT